MIITLSGMPGAGKSTVKTLLAQRLGFTAYSIGDLREVIAAKQGLSLDELNAADMRDGKNDSTVDDYQTRLGQTEDNFVIDGLLSWHFIPQSFKVFLSCNQDVAAKRIYDEKAESSGREDEPNYATVEETKQAISLRISQNLARYAKWYAVDPMDPTHYDLVIDTTNASPEDVANQIITAIS